MERVRRGEVFERQRKQVANIATYASTYCYM